MAWPLGLGGTAPLPDCDPTRPKARSLRTFAPSFANVISGWTVQTNQSTANAASYKSSDLQVAKASGIATKSFTMAHSMGLVRITLGTKQVNTTYTDYVNNEATDGITNSTKITITASNAFTGNIPYSHTDGKYYFVGKKATKPSFVTTSTGVRKWTQASVAPAANLAGNVYVELNPTVAWANNYFYKAYAYSCRAAQQTFSAQANTTYKIECWGSNGDKTEGSTSPFIERAYFYGGKGGYSKGYIRILINVTLYLYTGNNTAYSAGDATYANLTYNGGAKATSTSSGGNGGGGTDVRLVGGEWYSFAGRKARIMVAGGGGGGERRGAWYGDGDGGYGGGITGGTGEVVNHDNSKEGGWGYTLCAGGGQTSGGTSVYKNFTSPFSQSWFTGNNTAVSGAQGRFGRATFGNTHTTTTVVGLGPGGGGWYGGGSGFHAAGGGGSGFISGYPGCVAINQASSTDETHMVHKSGTNCERYDNTYYFTGFSGCYHTDSMVLAAGNQTFPSPTGSLTGSGTETGHNSTGYIIITVCPLED